MANKLQPIIGQWYLDRNAREMFRVVALDEPNAPVEIQTFDGDIEELEMEAWSEMDLEPIDAPEDWTGPFDDPESQQVSDSPGGAAQDWRSLLDATADRYERRFRGQSRFDSDDDEVVDSLDHYLAREGVL